MLLFAEELSISPVRALLALLEGEFASRINVSLIKRDMNKHSIFNDQQRHASSESLSIKFVETSVEHGVIYPNIPCLHPLVLTCILLIMLPSLSMRALMLAH